MCVQGQREPCSRPFSTELTVIVHERACSVVLLRCYHDRIRYHHLTARYKRGTVSVPRGRKGGHFYQVFTKATHLLRPYTRWHPHHCPHVQFRMYNALLIRWAKSTARTQTTNLISVWTPLLLLWHLQLRQLLIKALCPIPYYVNHYVDVQVAAEGGGARRPWQHEHGAPAKTWRQDPVLTLPWSAATRSDSGASSISVQRSSPSKSCPVACECAWGHGNRCVIASHQYGSYDTK